MRAKSECVEQAPAWCSGTPTIPLCVDKLLLFLLCLVRVYVQRALHGNSLFTNNKTERCARHLLFAWFDGSKRNSLGWDMDIVELIHFCRIKCRAHRTVFGRCLLPFPTIYAIMPCAVLWGSAMGVL